MTLKTTCPHCTHPFGFDTDTASRFIKNLIESEGNPTPEPEYYLPKCPKCLKQVKVPNPKKS